MQNLKEKLNKKLHKNGGFTLVEMLIVVAIIAILVAVSIPIVGNSLADTKAATDDANERAAKAAVLVEFYKNNGTAITDKFYDAKSGKIQDNAPSTGYGKGSKPGENSITEGTNERTGSIKLSVSADGAVSMSWES